MSIHIPVQVLAEAIEHADVHRAIIDRAHPVPGQGLATCAALRVDDHIDAIKVLVSLASADPEQARQLVDRLVISESQGGVAYLFSDVVLDGGLTRFDEGVPNDGAGQSAREHDGIV